MTRLTMAAVAALAVSLSGTARAEYIVNGDFETGDFTGFTVGAALAFAVPSGTVGYTAQSGNYFAALGDSPGLGSLSQTFTDVAKQALTVSFYLANNGGSPNEFRLDYNGTTLFDQTNIAMQPYTRYSFSVTGTGSDTLTFLESDGPGFLALDNVSVVATSAVPVPEPMSAVVLGAGLAGWGLTRRRR